MQRPGYVAPGAPSPLAKAIGDKADFVDKDEAPGINPALILLPLHAPARYLGPVLLDGVQRFLKLKPALRSNDQTV